jgi:predicted permease
MNGATAEQSDRMFDDILDRLRQQPGVQAAGVAVVTPLEGGMISLDFQVPGRPAKSFDPQTDFNVVSPQYFKTLEQTVLTGREFDDRDKKKSPKVAIVNQIFANQFFPGENPIGRRIKMDEDDIQIVGLVKNSYYQTLRETPGPLVYLPVKQMQSSGFALLVRTSLGRTEAVAEIKQAIHSVDARLPIFGVQEMQDLIDEGMTSERMLTFLAALFSALVTLLCSMGVYGLIAYAVTRRTREIGVRFAIGAQKKDVAALFWRECAVLIGAGVLLGVPLALASARLLKSLLFGVGATDVFSLVLTVAVFLAAGVLASLLPVRKATRIEPMVALRYE